MEIEKGNVPTAENKFKSFIDKCLCSEAKEEDIDNYVSEWHHVGHLRMNLAEWFGMSKEEFSKWILDDTVLSSIINSRKLGGLL
jgi:hypothetical protein